MPAGRQENLLCSWGNAWCIQRSVAASILCKRKEPEHLACALDRKRPPLRAPVLVDVLELVCMVEVVDRGPPEERFACNFHAQTT